MIAGLKKTVAAFVRDEDGAVTVDWVVLTAAVVGLGLVVASTVGQGTADVSAALGDDVDAVIIRSYTQSTPAGTGG